MTNKDIEIKGFKPILFIISGVVILLLCFYLFNLVDDNNIKKVKIDENLPIGTVITLKGVTEEELKELNELGLTETELTDSVMIYGRNQLNGSDNQTYDYVACFYPAGHVSAEHNIFFDKEEIKKIEFLGFTEK